MFHWWLAGGAVSGVFNGIVNHLNAVKNREMQQEAEENRQEIQKASQEGNHKLQRELFEKQRKLQLELLLRNRKTQLAAIQQQRETARQQPWYNKRVDNWPLRLVPEDIISAHPNRKPVPLQMILAPPEIDYDRFGNAEDFPRLEKRIAQKMRSLFDRYFPLGSDDRPVELLDRAWDSNRFGGGSSMKTMFNQLRSEPVLVLESEISGEILNLRVGYWSGGAENYNYKTAIADLPYLQILDDFARQRIRQWKADVYDKQIARGRNEEELRRRYPRQMAGLAVWRDEQEDLADGIPFDRHYPYVPEDDARFCDLFTSLHTLLAGVLADMHYLILENREPQLPAMLQEILPGFADAAEIQQMLEWVMATYEEAFAVLEGDRDAWLADLRLAFAEGLTHLEDKAWVGQQIDLSLQLFVQQRGGAADGSLSQLCEGVEAVAMSEDVPYLQRVNQVLRELGVQHQFDVDQLQRPFFYSQNSEKPYRRFFRDIRELQKHLQDISPERGQDPLVDRSLFQLESLIVTLGRKPNICLLGGFDAGKSTLANGLLKGEFLPTDFQPTTALPTYIHHIEDRPGWCKSDVLIFDESFDPLRWRDQQHCYEHLQAEGSLNDLERYVHHDNILEEGRLNHVLIYVKAAILESCNIIDYPGYGHDEQDDSQANTYMDVVDVEIYISPFASFLNSVDMKWLSLAVKTLPQFEYVSPEFPTLGNLFVLASHISTKKKEKLEKAFDKASERGYRELSLAFQAREELINRTITREDFHKVLHSFYYDEDRNLVEGSFFDALDNLLNEAIPKIFLQGFLHELEKLKNTCVQEIPNKIEACQNQIENLNKLEATYNECMKAEPQRQAESDRKKAWIEEYIREKKRESISEFRHYFHNSTREERLESLIRERYDSEQEAKENAIGYLLEETQSEFRSIIEPKTQNVLSVTESFLAEYQEHGEKYLAGTAFTLDAAQHFAIRVASYSEAGTFASLTLDAGGTGGTLPARQLIAVGHMIRIALASSYFIAHVVLPVVLVATVTGWALHSAFRDPWQRVVAKKIIEKINEEGIEDKLIAAIEKYWDDSLVAFSNGIAAVEEQWQSNLKSLEYQVENPEKGVKDIEFQIEQLKAAHKIFSNIH